MRTLTVAAAWVVLVPLLGFALLRLTGVTGRSARLFALETLTMWLLLPAYAVAVVALAVRARALLAAALAVVVLHAVWVGPELRWWSSGTPAPQGEAFVVAAANIYARNAQDEAAATALAGIDADVVAVVELTPQAASELELSGFTDRYPHRTEDPQRTAFGSGIYSRHPIVEAEVLDVAGASMTRAVIDLPSGRTTVVAVHTRQPLADLQDLHAQLAGLADLVRGAEGPVILAGDFNATRQHAPFRALLEAGLVDSHLATGRGLAATWPTTNPLPPFALIDHVLVSEGDFAVLDTREVTIPGSDHKAVVARLAGAAR